MEDKVRDDVAAHLLHALSILRSHHLYGELPQISSDVRDCLKLIGEPIPTPQEQWDKE